MKNHILLAIITLGVVVGSTAQTKGYNKYKKYAQEMSEDKNEEKGEFTMSFIMKKLFCFVLDWLKPLGLVVAIIFFSLLKIGGEPDSKSFIITRLIKAFARIDDPQKSGLLDEETQPAPNSSNNNYNDE